MVELINRKSPFYPKDMVVNVPVESASELLKTGLWSTVDSAVVINAKPKARVKKL